jgi:hypothetical protein
LLIFIITIAQAVAPNAAAKFPSTEQEHYAFNNAATVCDKGPFEGYHPLRYKYADGVDPR